MTMPSGQSQSHSETSSWDQARFSPMNDADLCNRMFQEASSRLFKNDQSNEFEILYARHDNSLAELKLKGYNDIYAELDRANDFSYVKTNLFYIIRQENSWGRLLIAPDIFHEILSRNKVFASYLDFVRAFGYKNNDDDYLQNGDRWHLSQDLNNTEYCYNIRFVEKHGRAEGDSWSLRQMGVYQQLDLVKHECRWILLQPSAHVLQRLREFITLDQPDGINRDSTSRSDHLGPHVIIIMALARNWAEYIETQRRSLDELDEKVCFSRVGRASKFDYSVTFSDCQRLQQIRKKSLRAQLALENSLVIAQGCETKYKSLRMTHKLRTGDHISLELHTHVLDLKAHIRTVTSILEHASWVADMLKHILEYRYDDAIRNNSQSLAEIASDSRNESQTIAAIAKDSAVDAKSLKALTILATLYLPASLLATIFSSNLIQLRGAGQMVQDTHFAVAGEFWVYVVTTLGGTLLTVSYIFWFSGRRLHRINTTRII